MKGRLSILYFLQFGVWGCYLTCLGQFLGAGGLGSMISWFYAAIGIVSILTPSLMGRLADMTSEPQRLLGCCHLTASIAMLCLWHYGATHPALNFLPTFLLYVAFLAFYMPTMALANTVSFRLLEQNGYSTVKSFPHIRIWGTIGFIAGMWFVNSAYVENGGLHFTVSDATDPGQLRFQYNAMQLLCSCIVGLLAGVYAFTLPSTEALRHSQNVTLNEKTSFIIAATRMCGIKEIAVFLLFVVLSGVCLQISNGFATPYITHFVAYSEYAGSLAAGNATMLFSLSQISEAFCILLVGLALKWNGIKWVYAIGLTAWGLRFLMLGLGNPTDGLWLLIASMLIYGIAFNFITIAGHLHIQQIAPKESKGLAQGLMMFMSNGIGATTGIFIAGAIVNHWCQWEMTPVGDKMVRLFMGDWQWPWLIFACYALAVALIWIIFFKSTSSNTDG